MLLLVGGLYSTSFFSPNYLLQQLQVASFLGIVATGMMLVILLGHIDLSVPWVLTVGGMMSTAAVSWGGPGRYLAIPFGILCGAVFGAANGIGVAYLRIPSMIFTLGINAVAQGLMVLQTGGFAPQDHARRRCASSPPTAACSASRRRFGLGAGRHRDRLHAHPDQLRPRHLRHRQQRARRLSLRHQHAAGHLPRLRHLRRLAGFAGVLLAGYSTNAYQSMGDPYLLPAIAAVVLGGTRSSAAAAPISAPSPA